MRVVLPGGLAWISRRSTPMRTGARFTRSGWPGASVCGCGFALASSLFDLLVPGVVPEPDGIQRGLSYQDRKSTRLNSSHTVISYAVFCLKKKIAIINLWHATHRK